MKHKQSIALVLILVLLISYTGFTPAQAEQSPAETNKQPQQPQEVLAPGLVDQEQFAQEDHLQRLPDEERMDTYVYLNRDGTKSIYYMGRNVKYRDHNGQVRDKDTTLVRGDRGYRMRDNDVELHIPDSPADGITLAYGTDSVKLFPQGGSGNANLADNSITYAGFFGPETALRYTPLLEGVKEDIILSSYTGQNSFAFILETGGLHLYEAEGQYYLAESEEADPAFYLGQIVVYDAVGCPDDGNMTVETLVPGMKYRLTLSADLDFLTCPETVYPVTIDPSLTVGFSVQGVDAIVDAPLYEGYPNNNYYNNYYNFLGYYNDTYQTARTVMRPEALLSSNEWQSIDSDSITGLSLFVKDSSGQSSQQVNIHALTTNSTWSESTVTWNNVGNYSNLIFASATLGIGAWTEFDLTTLARTWKDGLQNEDCGFLLKMADETLCRGFLSCEYSTADYRPYMVLSYETEAYLNYAVKDLDEGDSFVLAAGSKLGIAGSVTWSSANASIASVTQGGVVTGHLAGITTITASFTDNSGNNLSASCTVYVTVADGLYYIKNAASGLCMQTASGSNHMFAQNTTTASRHTQLWKITYVSDGNYVIRPLSDFSMALTVSSAEYVTIGNTATINSAVSSNFLWKIELSSLGYAFLLNGSDTQAMAPVVSGMSGSQVYATDLSDSAVYRWELEEAQGIFLRDDGTHKLCNTTNPYTIEIEHTVTLDDLGITIETYGSGFSSESWLTGNSEVATVDSDGDITTLCRGKINITVRAYANGVAYSHYCTIIVYETVYITNLYDSTITEDSLIHGYIDDAVQFLNTIYEDSLYLHFVMDGDPLQYENAAVDICSRGRNVDCHANYCAPNCKEHCKNVNRISKELYETWEPNHVIVFWSNSPSYVFCEFEYNQHSPTEALAQVAKIEYDNGEEISPSVIQIYSINQYDINLTGGYRGNELAVMSVLLAHEIAHTLELGEQYIYASHEHEGQMQCIMEGLDMQYLDSFYSSIQNLETAFCDDCIAKLEDIPQNSYWK